MTGSKSNPDLPSAELRPEVQRIIQSGRKAEIPPSGSASSAALLVAVSLFLLWLSFTPVQLAPLAWIALVPLCQLLRLRSLPRFCLLFTWLVAFVWACATLQWMRYGHPAMYFALAALSFYVSMYIPAFVWIGRRCIARGLPLWLAVPIVWTALEYVRAYMLTGFSWYYLGHSQYRWTSLIQISDVVGAYGVSFVVAFVSGAISEHVPLAWLKRLQLDVPDVGVATVSRRAAIGSSALLLLSCGYGFIRQTPSSDFPAGPAFALIQGNFTPEVKHDRDTMLTRHRVHDGLTRNAVALQPDFIVWPETMFSWPELSVADGVTDENILSHIPAEDAKYYGNEAAVFVQQFRTREIQQRLEQDSQAAGAAIVMGLIAQVADKDNLKTYNSAAFVRPDLGYAGRYDKVHRVLFGEYVPLKDVFPFLANLTPVGSTIDAGSEVKLFEYAGFRASPLICFEDTVPHLVSRMAAQRDADGKECDVLVNLTNDAWFHGSSELDQHLITSAFRCVENRVPMVRCVNGGISAFIDGNGEIREPEQILEMKEPFEGLTPQLSPVNGLRDPQTRAWRRQFSGIIFGQVPLDPRESLYTRFGDWFASLCLLLTAVFLAKSFQNP